MMNKTPTLFPDIPDEPHQAFPYHTGRCTAGVCGRGPKGETCGTCAHLVRRQSNVRFYLKCGLMRHNWTNGYGTDIRARWPACEHWEKLK